MTNAIDEVIQSMIELDRLSRSKKRAKLIPKAINEGLRLSQTVCAQPEEVVATPLMKNLLIIMGDVQQVRKNGEWTTEKLKTGAQSKAVKWVNEVVNKCRTIYNGREVHDYPRDLPINDPQYYNVDCWNGWKPEIWDIQPGQADERKKRFKEYGNPKTNLSVEALIKMIRKDPVLRKAIQIELSIWPEVQASREITEVSDPFMSKGTGISYPYYRNDRTIVPGTNITYGKWLIRDLTKIYVSKGLDALIEYAYNYAVATGYPRNQRGKGRALIAMSRIVNLVVNMVNSPEMELWKQNKWIGAAFQNEEELLSVLSEACEWCVQNAESAYNLDYSSWDFNLGAGWLCLQDAMRLLRAKDQQTRELIKFRYACATNVYFVDGPNKAVYIIYGRQMSGYDDTTLGNTCANRVISRYSAMMSRKDYSSKITDARQGRDLICVGDDVLILGIGDDNVTPFAHSANKRCRVVLHEDEKHAKGVMFIQWRCIKLNGKYIIAYNWPRVLRSMLSKEDAKHLGRGGWTLAFYQQLGKLRQVPDRGLNIVVNIAAACDPYHLSLDTPIETIMDWVKDEDAKRVKTGTANRASKMSKKQTTAERLYNRNPNILGVKVDGDKIEIDQNYFAALQKELKAVYDPEFLPKLGIKNPDLSKVHFD